MPKKDKRLHGMYDKNVYFVKRHKNPEFGCYFDLTTDKEICNDWEDCKFYLKVGGVAFLEKVVVKGQSHREAKEKLRESNHFGGYLFFTTTSKKLRVVLYAKKTLYSPGDILISRANVVHSVIPRYHGDHPVPRVISGMKIDGRSGRDRKWEKYDGHPLKEQHNGFHYIYENDNLDVLGLVEENRRMYYGAKTGIYVPKNTTLLIQDGGRAYAHMDYYNFLVWTVCQEGAFIAIQQDFRYVFYDENDGEEYDSFLVYKEKRERFYCPNFLLLSGNHLDRILFLSPPPQFTAWILRICRVKRKFPFEAQLCVPSGGRFETVMDWEDGIKEVRRRQAKKPWLKYIEAFDNLSHADSLSELDLENTEAYPLQDENEDEDEEGDE